jgi:hypothetical protein
MNSLRSLLLGVALLISCLSTLVRGAEPWETAAIRGFTAMNQGDGKAFAEVAHPDYKAQMRTYMLERLHAAPTSADTQKILKDFGVANIDKMEKFSSEQFIQKLIYSMHVSMPAPMRTALEQAQVKVISSEPDGDDYRVTVELSFAASGKTGANKMILLVKRDGDAWKYDGTSK